MPRHRRPREPSSPNIHLQRLVQQPGRIQPLIAFRPHRHEFLLRDRVTEMLVLFLLIAHTHPGGGGASVRGIVVSWPDRDVFG